MQGSAIKEPGSQKTECVISAGNGCVSHDEEMTQMAIWSISASPLIMGNDMRNISADSLAILKNADAIAVSQDPLGQMGIRLSNDTATQVCPVWDIVSAPKCQRSLTGFGWIHARCAGVGSRACKR